MSRIYFFLHYVILKLITSIDGKIVFTKVPSFFKYFGFKDDDERYYERISEDPNKAKDLLEKFSFKASC